MSSSGRNDSDALSLTMIWFLFLDFHTGCLSPSSARPTPISLHFFGGLMPISTRFDQILSPLLSHLCILSSCSSSLGCHLLFSMRRMASEETLKCSASTGVVNLWGCVWCKCRMPSIVSGDNFLRGFQASPFSFFFMASFSSCHAGRVTRASFHSAVLSSNVVVSRGFGGRVGASRALCGGRLSGKGSDVRLYLVCRCREPNAGLISVKERTKRVSVFRAQLWQFITDDIVDCAEVVPPRSLEGRRTD